MKRVKEIGFAYPTSDYAKQLGFYKTGVYVLTTRNIDGSDVKIESHHICKLIVLAYALSLHDIPWTHTTIFLMSLPKDKRGYSLPPFVLTSNGSGYNFSPCFNC